MRYDAWWCIHHCILSTVGLYIIYCKRYWVLLQILFISFLVIIQETCDHRWWQHIEQVFHRALNVLCEQSKLNHTILAYFLIGVYWHAGRILSTYAVDFLFLDEKNSMSVAQELVPCVCYLSACTVYRPQHQTSQDQQGNSPNRLNTEEKRARRNCIPLDSWDEERIGIIIYQET